MAGVVMAPEVAAALGETGRSKVEQTLRRGPVPCQACGGRVSADTDDVAVQVHLDGTRAGVQVVTFTHPRCAPSAVVTDAAARAVLDAAGTALQDAVAMLGELNGAPAVVFDSQVSAYLDLGADTSDAATTVYLRAGFALVTGPVERLDPREVPVLRDWEVRLTDRQLWIGRPGADPHLAYEQGRTPEAEDWVLHTARPGPVLLLTGGGVAPLAGREGEEGAWEASIEAARRDGRLVAARVPLRISR